ADDLRTKLRPSLGHKQSAVAGKTRERHFHKIERRSFAAGGNVAHQISFDRTLSCQRRPHQVVDSTKFPGFLRGLAAHSHTIRLALPDRNKQSATSRLSISGFPAPAQPDRKSRRKNCG